MKSRVLLFAIKHCMALLFITKKLVRFQSALNYVKWHHKAPANINEMFNAVTCSQDKCMCIINACCFVVM